MSEIVIGAATIGVMAFAVHHPTLKHLQRLVINLRAARLVVPEMLEAAREHGRNIWPEMQRRVKYDV